MLCYFIIKYYFTILHILNNHSQPYFPVSRFPQATIKNLITVEYIYTYIKANVQQLDTVNSSNSSCLISISISEMSNEYESNPAVNNLRDYLRIRSVHPNVNYGKYVVRN